MLMTMGGWHIKRVEGGRRAGAKNQDVRAALWSNAVVRRNAFATSPRLAGERKGASSD